MSRIKPYHDSQKGFTAFKQRSIGANKVSENKEGIRKRRGAVGDSEGRREGGDIDWAYRIIYS